ncbi:hypothetical protein AB834_01050 [PVC group bacterium (ex Bugula neritina AB1)]|nr:hypothetical protein AB834_01050 [PVC group bacterium (ex Bugula neritina AB1)]
MFSNEGHRKRLYDRFDKVGFKGFSEHEKLEILLCLSIPRKDCKNLAKKLIEKFKTVLGVFYADRRDLESVMGLGQKTSRFLSIIKAVLAEGIKEDISLKQKFLDPDAVSAYLMMKQSKGRQETFKVLFLDTQYQLLGEEDISRGTIDEAPVYIRNIVELAIKYNAKAVILSHNHPSGQPTPSLSDKEVTLKIKKALSLLDIDILDHLIIGDHRYISFVREGLLE